MLVDRRATSHPVRARAGRPDGARFGETPECVCFGDEARKVMGEFVCRSDEARSFTGRAFCLGAAGPELHARGLLPRR